MSHAHQRIDLQTGRAALSGSSVGPSPRQTGLSSSGVTMQNLCVSQGPSPGHGCLKRQIVPGYCSQSALVEQPGGDPTSAATAGYTTNESRTAKDNRWKNMRAKMREEFPNYNISTPVFCSLPVLNNGHRSVEITGVPLRTLGGHFINGTFSLSLISKIVNKNNHFLQSGKTCLFTFE